MPYIGTAGSVLRAEKPIDVYKRQILFHVLPDVGPVYTVSIIPTGIGAAGYTMPLPERDEMFNTKGKMLQNIIVDLGGRVAEAVSYTHLVGFGTFAVSERAAREGRNPHTGEPMQIAASKAPKFTAGKALKDALN